MARKSKLSSVLTTGNFACRMRRSGEQVIGILKQHEAGVKTADLCREHGISAATFYGWKSKFGGMDVSEAQRLKALERDSFWVKLSGADRMTATCTDLNVAIRPMQEILRAS